MKEIEREKMPPSQTRENIEHDFHFHRQMVSVFGAWRIHHSAQMNGKQQKGEFNSDENEYTFLVLPAVPVLRAVDCARMHGKVPTGYHNLQNDIR